MENCFETSQGQSNLQDNSCRTEKLRESYLILKQKICKSHELIQRYNDKIKECERLKTDLAAANNEVRRMTGNYNTSLANVIRVELQNTEYKKKIELLESKVENFEAKMLVDQKYIQQLICKMKETHKKHAETVAKYDLKASSLQGTITDLRHELTAAKRICERQAKRTASDKTEGVEDEVTEKEKKTFLDRKSTVDIGLDTVDLCPMPALMAQRIDMCTLTDEFYNTNDNPYPLFCEKCEVLLHPPPLEKICHIMKQCPRIVEEFTSPLSNPPATPPRLPPTTSSPPTSPLRSVPFAQTAVHNEPAHSTPVSSPPPPSSPAMEKVVDQRPLVRMLMKRVNRLEMKIDAQNTARNQSVDPHCRSVCLRDTITSVSDFFRQVTRIAAENRENSRSSSRISRKSRIRLSRSHNLRSAKLKSTRSRLPRVSSCSGVWEVNPLKKIENEKANRVRKKDTGKPSNVSSNMVRRIVQRQLPIKSVVSTTSLHSLSESMISDSMSFSYEELSDNNENKTDDSILTYDDDRSSNENEIFDGKVDLPVIKKNKSSTGAITLNRDKMSMNNQETLGNYYGHRIPRKELFLFDYDSNDAKVEASSNKNEAVIDFHKINSNNDINIPSTSSDINAQQSILINKPEDNVANSEPVSINKEAKTSLSEVAPVDLDRSCIEPDISSDTEDELSPPAKTIGISYTLASPDPNVDEQTEMRDPIIIPTDSTVDLTENSIKSHSTVNMSEINTEHDRDDLSNEENALFANHDMTDTKISTPSRSILIPIRRSHRHNKIEDVMQSENSRLGMNMYDNTTAINDYGGGENSDSNEQVGNGGISEGAESLIQDEHEPNESIENCTNIQKANENNTSSRSTHANGIMSESMKGCQLSVSASPMTMLHHHITKKEILSKTVDMKQTRKKKLQKKPDDSKVWTNTFVKKQFQKLIDNEWDLSLHNDILEKLSKTCGARIIAKLSVEFLSELSNKNKDLDRTHTPPAPLMTKEQQKMITLMVDLNFMKPGVIRYVQAGIQYKLFRLNSAPEREVMENLGRVYVVLARIMKDREILRIFCCDALYCLGLGAISIIYIVLTCWPEVFPVRRENIDILPKCIAHFILQQKAVAYFPKLLPLKNLITGLYMYSSTDLVKADLLKELLSNLEKESQNGLYTAIILFAKREGLAWTYKNIVRDGLLPMIIGERHPNVYAAFCLLGNLMRSFPVADADGTVGEIVDQLRDLMNSGEGSDEQQEGVASALLSLSRHRFESVAQSVLAWQSIVPLRQRTIEQLKVLFDSKPIEYWRSFIKKRKLCLG